MHWVYILRCHCEDDPQDRRQDRIYIGETERLFRRLKEHKAGHYGTASGSVTTSKYLPKRLIGLYKVSDEDMIDHGDPINKDMYKMGYIPKIKGWALDVEDKITLQYMKAMGRKWKQVFGGKWHGGHPRNNNPSKNCTINRPYCKCKVPADICEYNDKKYWRCSQKNFYNWDEMTNFLKEIRLQRGTTPCNFYQPWKECDTFNECSIYGDEDTIKLSGQCFISSDDE